MRIKVVAGCIGLVVVAGLAVWVVQWSNGPATVTIANSQTDVKGLSTEVTAFEADEFTTQVTSNFVVKTRTSSRNTTTQGQYLLVDQNTRVNAQVAITVGKSSAASMNEVSGVAVRALNPSEYTEIEPDDGFPQGSRVFIKLNGYEKGVFWVDNGRLASVVVSGGAENQAELEQALKTALTNWQWEQD